MPGSHSQGAYDRIYAVVRRIPRGRVATYGQVAQWAGLPGRARQVGYALHALGPESAVPWHRVINARGRVSARRQPGGDRVQRQLLEREGVRFDDAGRVSLARHVWTVAGDASAKRARRGGEAQPSRRRVKSRRL